MKAAIYCRVSTDNQEREGTSLQTQLESCVAKGNDDVEIKGVIPLELALPTTAQTRGCMCFHRNILRY